MSFDSQQFLAGVPQQPGVYQMLDAHGEIIYIGKAADLKKRLSNYFSAKHHDIKTATLVARIERIETIITHTESEALLLENNLIKRHKPRYNILYRDDKSYPYIYVSTQQEFPRLGFHRGAQRLKGHYFGPYPSAGAVRDTLQLLQKIFPVRQCEDSFFKNRSRPCLQYQIKRCTAPCVGLISQSDYNEDVRHALLFLQGRSQQVAEELAQRMDSAARQLHYERAATIRDQITSLRRVQEKQYITQAGGDCDIIAAASEQGMGCVQVFSIRGGRNLGNKTFFPRSEADNTTHALLTAFLSQYYLPSPQAVERDIPAQIFVAEKLDGLELLTTLLCEHSGRRVQIRTGVRGKQARWIAMARQNTQSMLKTRLLSQSTLLRRFSALQDLLHLDERPEHIECFDISHTQGEASVAACVVFNSAGPQYSLYRHFNISDITPGDDYAAMEQVLLRRYKKIEQGEGKIPDIIFIDGGKGQVQRALKVMEELQLNSVLVIGVAKGADRRVGQETLILPGVDTQSNNELQLPPDSLALHLIQQIRDEAHRFAISGHRKRRQKTRSHSVLEEIHGLGVQRRQRLLRHFGGLQEIARAGIEDLAQVPGINTSLAQRIYDTFHNST
ncbi:MAG: excinuclease ABC subunit UvrC [Gammaproteobacteria bacterium]|nr:excinuclease ABC subunit UvrC [Gammaproteobacteria bacterium]